MSLRDYLENSHLFVGSAEDVLVTNCSSRTSSTALHCASRTCSADHNDTNLDETDHSLNTEAAKLSEKLLISQVATKTPEMHGLSLRECLDNSHLYVGSTEDVLVYKFINNIDM